MYISSLFFAFTAAAFGTFTTEQQPLELSDWRLNEEGDVRSPCPMLDTLANHGLLPHDGKGLTLGLVKDVLKEHINVGPDFALLAIYKALQLSHEDSFDLSDLDVHNTIEHDASFSRQDAYFGDFHTFNETIFEQTNQFFQDEHITPQHMADAKCARIRDSRANNPEFLTNLGYHIAGYTEASLILSVFGDPHTGIVEHPEYVTYWFRNRKFPYELGWQPPQHETNFFTLGLMMKRIHDNTPEDCRTQIGLLDLPMH